MNINGSPTLRHDNSEAGYSTWRRVLTENPLSGFPPDFSLESPVSPQFEYESFTFADADQMFLAQDHGLGIRESLLAAYAVLLARYTANHRVNAASLNFTEELGGNLKFMQIDLMESVTFGELVRNVQEYDAGAGERWNEAECGEDFLFASAFSYHEKRPAVNHQRSQLQAAIHFMLSAEETGIHLLVRYQAAKFKPASIRRLSGAFRRLWLCGIRQASSEVFRLPLMSGEEVEHMAVRWNETKSPYPDQCLHEMLEFKAREDAQAPAIRQGRETVSRGELNARANRLAYRIMQRKQRRNEPIGIYMDKSIDIIVGLVAILKAGCAYVPMDPAYPLERFHYMLRDADIQLLITERELLTRLPEDYPVQAILPKEEGELLDGLPDTDPKLAVSPEDLCYLIYTSGSTGDPKGVMLNHRGRVNNFHDFNTRFSISENDSLLAVSAVGFDMFCYDVFGMLAAGGTVVVPQRELAEQPIHWLKEVASKGITIWHSVPVLLELLVKCSKHRNMDLSSLRVILLGGDWIPVDLPGRVRDLIPGSRIISLGGATEASMDSILYCVEEVEPHLASIPYGKPMANQRAYILDPWLQPVPVSVPGELYLGGIGVAEGYYNKPELTAERFIPNPWQPGTKMYKTGDSAKYTDDGTIILLGRMDHQVKINGIRIELGEIEYWLRKHPQVENCVVLPVEYAPSRKKIISFIQSKSGEHIDPALLQDYMGEHLPSSFVPSETRFVHAIPTTPNGKVDRRRLQEVGLQPIQLQASDTGKTVGSE